MSEEEKKAIEILNFRLDNVKEYESLYTWKDELGTILNLIQSQQKEIEKKDKIIDEMADNIVYLIEYNNPEEIRDVEEIKQYFEKKIQEEN